MRIQPSTIPTNKIIYNFKNTDTEKQDVSEIIPEKTPEKKNKYASSVTVITLGTVGCAFMLSRSSQKNTSKLLNKLKIYFEQKAEHSSLNSSERKTRMYEKVVRGLNSFINKTDSINNITSLKDILFMKLMYKTKPTKKIHQSITDYFEKLSRKTVSTSYEKAKKEFEEMNRIFDELDKFILKNSPDEVVEYKGERYTKKKLVELAKGHRDTANLIFNTFISDASQEARYKHINNITSNLYSKFWDASFKDFWSKNNRFKRREMWQTFIAAEQIKGGKSLLIHNISIARNALTYTSEDKGNLLRGYIKNIDNIIPANDKQGIDIIKHIEWYANHPEALDDNKTEFLRELSKLERHKINQPDENIQMAQEESKKAGIAAIKELIENDDPGVFQDMLSVYYKISPFELERSGASKSVKRAVKAFDKALNLECDDFVDKIRDLRLGSAPTDILTILFSTLTLSVGLGYAKDKDKRISLMYKSGIPIIGGITTATLAATKLVAGGKSIMLGLLAGIVLNRLGAVSDNIHKSYNKKSAEN